MGKGKKRKWRELCSCGAIFPERCRSGRRFYPRSSSDCRLLLGPPGGMFAVAVADSPWPFLVLFLIFDFLNFFDFFFFGSKKKKKNCLFSLLWIRKIYLFFNCIFFSVACC